MVAFEARIDRDFRKGFSVCVCVFLCSLLLFQRNSLLQSYKAREPVQTCREIVVQNLKEHLQTYSSLKGPVEVERDVQWFGKNAVLQQVPEYGVCRLCISELIFSIYFPRQ